MIVFERIFSNCRVSRRVKIHPAKNSLNYAIKSDFFPSSLASVLCYIHIYTQQRAQQHPNEQSERAKAARHKSRVERVHRYGKIQIKPGCPREKRPLQSERTAAIKNTREGERGSRNQSLALRVYTYIWSARRCPIQYNVQTHIPIRIYTWGVDRREERDCTES